MLRHLSTGTAVFAALMETERTVSPQPRTETAAEIARMLAGMGRRRPLPADRRLPREQQAD
jgi:hypothetical protein